MVRTQPATTVAPEPESSGLIWWQRGVVYQIYPRSFQDTNGDGVGDLRGIAERLDHLVTLGVDAIWISPIFASPMADFGYDIADYCAIHPLFGTMDDFDHLLEQAHARGLKLILDFVPNHTSDQHTWFRESRSSRDDPKRDWFIWRDPAPDGGPPNNWISNFGGPAWQYDEATGQYYYHAFLREQPDLNWRNPEVRAAMHDVLRFWLDRGVDGFRVDVLWHLMKDPEFRDNPPNPAYQPHDPEINRFLQVYSADHPDILEVVTGLRAVLDEYSERVLIGEIYLPLERLVAYYGHDLSGAHLPFNFQLIESSWHAHTIARIIHEYEELLPQGGWPNWVLSNHDKPRIAARVGQAQARVAAMMLLTLRGTPTIYYGDEIGLGHVEIPPERVQDPWEKNEPGLGLGRDPSRTPMQWQPGHAAGFSRSEPWLPVTADATRCNVATQAEDPRSIFTLYRRLLALRRSREALISGDDVQIEGVQGDVLVYGRGGSRLLVALNMSATPCRLNLQQARGRRLLLSTYLDREGEMIAGALDLRGDEGVVLERV